MISLCLIVGNVQEYIERCLRSFAAIGDEIVVVRAIGNAKPDATQEIAMRVCKELGKPLVFADYKNKPEHADWPHVDSFAAARQMSFDLAKYDYAFWCDTDDILESGAELVRQHAREAKYAAYIFPYKILGLGVSVPRERLILRDAGHWHYPVHECFRFNVEPVNGAQDDGVVIVHSPRHDKTGSNERNLRILKSIPDEEMHPGLLYHLHGELMGIGDKQGAVDAALRAFNDPRLGKAEKYEMLMNLARIAEKPAEKEVFLHEAFRCDPARREALGVLSGNALDFGRPDLAMVYAQQMRATPAPQKTEWNHRHGFYGWLGDDIYQQALRMNGAEVDANRLRIANYIKAGGCKISLLHATRGRPQRAVLARKSWYDMAEHPEQIEHIFAFDADDVESAPLERFHHTKLPPGGGCVAAWNAAANLALGEVLVQLSDDWLPSRGWDTQILNAIGDTSKPSVLAISDGHRKDDLLCMAICTKVYTVNDKFLFHPDFTGVYSDNWFTKQAYDRGAVIQARHIEFLHQHPIFTGEAMDATHAAQNAPHRYAEGKAVYDRLCQGNDWSTCEGWFDYYHFYKEVADALGGNDIAVEVGSYKGRSIAYLAQRLARQGKHGVALWAVDSFKDAKREELSANLIRCGCERVRILEADSAASAAGFNSESVTFAYIDAAHDYESVKRDIAAWLPKIKSGGILAGHDAQSPGVQKAVKELLPNAEFYLPVWMYRKP